MKIRTDYVTNSSSSSFILGFNNENSIEEELHREYVGNRYSTLLNDIKKGSITKDEAVKKFKEWMRWHVIWSLENAYERKIGYWEFSDWIKNHDNKKEFDQSVDEEIERLTKAFILKINDYGYLALVHYSDDVNGDLEHEIVPQMNCNIQQFSYH